MQIAPKITTCLWFDNQAEEAAAFYTAIFKNSSIGRITRYGKEGFEIHGRPAGTVMTVEFELDGQAQQCGWRKDKFGLSWKVVPRALSAWLGDPGSEKSQRAMRAMLQMKKIDMESIRQAYDGTA